MSRGLKTGIVAVLLAASSAGATAAAPSALAVGSNLECDNSVSHKLICELNAQGLGTTFSGERWTVNGYSYAYGDNHESIIYGCSSSGSYTVSVTYQDQSGQSYSEWDSLPCNLGMSW
jgi:hypothetical protein